MSIGRIGSLFAICAITLTIAAAGTNAAGFSFMDSVTEFLGFAPTQTTAPITQTAEPNDAPAMEPMFLTAGGSITAFGSPLTENFDGLSSTVGTGVAWADNTTISGAYSDKATYNVATGSSNAGALYSFGVAGTNAVTDRALGGIGSSGTGTIYWAFRLTNNTGANIGSLDISYNGEQWRDGGNTPAVSQPLDFQYQVANSGTVTDANVPSTGWTSFAPLAFVSPKFTTTAATLDGNAVANRTAKAATLTFGTPVVNGQEIWIRWVDINDTGNDHGLAVDDLSITATAAQGVTEPTTHASAMSFSNITSSQMDVSWTSGNGASRIVVARQGAAPTGTPADGTAYPANPFGTSASALGNGYVVCSGSSSSCTVTGLQPALSYSFAIYEYNGSGGTTNYLTSGTPATGTQQAAAIPPTMTTSVATAIGTTTATLNGSANANNSVANVSFRYSTTSPGTCNDTFGTQASLGQIGGSSTMTKALTNLTPGATYYFCAIGTNAGGTAFGNLLSFTTVATYTLTVDKVGTGTGGVTSNPAGITCGADCTEVYTAGQVVQLTAVGLVGSTFGGWSGDCSGQPAVCTVTMSQARSATATFTRIQHTLTVTKDGGSSCGSGGACFDGLVTSQPTGISCGLTCSAGYDQGTVVSLTAAADSSSRFAGWSGDCSCSGPTCDVTMSAAKSCTATFGQGFSVASTDPPDGATGVSPTAPVKFTFTAPANPGTVTMQSSSGACTGSVQLSSDNFATCVGGGTPTPSVGDTVFTLVVPPATLTPGYTYKLSLSVAITSATGSHLASPFTQTNGFTLALSSQTITFNPLPALKFGDPDFDLTTVASSSAGLALSFATSPQTVCTVSGSSLHIVSAGDCTVTASQAGDATHSAAQDVQRVRNITRDQPILEFTSPPSSLAFGRSATLQVSGAPGGSAVSFTASGGACTVTPNGGVVTMTSGSVGTCTVTASTAQSTNYEAASVQCTISPIRESPTLTFAQQPPSTLAYGKQASVSVTGTPGGTTASFVASGGACTVTPTGMVTMTSGSVGTCHVAVSTPQTADYEAGSLQCDISPIRESPTLAITNAAELGNPSFTGSPFTVSFTVTNSGGAASGTLTPTGMLRVMSDGSVVCTYTLAASDNGAASCDVTPSSPRTYHFVAIYVGDENYASGASSPPVDHVVSPAPAKMTVSAPVIFGDVQIGTESAPQIVTVTNTGFLDLGGISIVLEGVDPDQFVLLDPAPQCPSSLSSGQSCNIRVAFRPTSLGLHNARITAVSNAQHGTVSLPASRGIDSPLSVASFTGGPAESSTSGTDVTFSFTSSKSVPTFTCKIDILGEEACVSPRSFTALSDGQHTFTVIAIDSFGNPGPPVSRTWTVDATHPVTTILSRPPSFTDLTNADFTFTSSDAVCSTVSFTCSLDNAAFSSCASPLSYSSLAEGSHTVQVRATDSCGNVEAAARSVTWVIDTMPPTVSIVSHPPATTSSSNAQFTFTGDDAGSGVAKFECKLDGETAFTTCTSPRDLSGLQLGDHTFSVRSVDQAGNRVASIDSFTWTRLAASTDASLSDLLTSAGVVQPTFSPTLFTYTLSVPAATSSLTLRPRCGSPIASVTVEGTPVSCDVDTAPISLSVGDNVLHVHVVAEDGSTQSTYVLTVTRATPTVTLSLSLAGTGSGSIHATPGGATCPGTCTPSYPLDTVVTLDASPSSDSTFAGWSGACTSSASTCQVTMSAAKDVTATFTQNQATVTFTSTNPGTLAYLHTYTPTATTNSDGALSFSVSPAATCSITNGVVRMDSGVGTCTVTAQTAATAQYPAGSRAQLINASPETPSLSFSPAPPSTLPFGRTAQLSVSGAPGGSAVSYAATGGACDVSTSGVVTMTSGSVGTCTVTASTAQSTNYEAASVECTISPIRESPTLQSTGQTSVSYSGSPQSISVAAVAGGIAGGAVAGIVVCRYDGSTTAPTNAATYQVRCDFTPSDTEDYFSLTDVSVGAFTITRATPTLSFSVSPPSELAYGRTASIQVTGNPGGSSPLSFAATGGACTVSPTGLVTMTSGSVGTCTVTASTSQSTNYEAASIQCTISPIRESPTLTFSPPPPSELAYGETATITVTGAPGGSATAFHASGGACTVSPTGLVTMTSGSVGTCTVSASTGQTPDFEPASVECTITPKRSSAVIVAIANSAELANPTVAGEPVPVAFSNSRGAIASGVIRAFSGTAEVCSATLANGVATCSFTPDVAGTYQLSAHYDGDSNFEPMVSSPPVEHLVSPRPATLSVSAPLSFGSVQLSTVSQPQTITLSNAGDLDLQISSMFIDGVNPDDFVLQAAPPASCPATLHSGEMCTRVVTFSPKWASARSARLSVQSGGGSVQVELSGTGIDTTTPVSSFTSGPAEGSTSGPDVTFTFASSKPATVSCTLDGNPTTCDSSLSLTALSGGQHTLTVVATDTFGNAGPAETRTWAVDTTAPVTTIVSRPPQFTSLTSAQFTFTVSLPPGTPATFECSLDTAPFTTCTKPVRYSALSEGSHTFQVRARDSFGNAEASAKSFTWTIDTMPPTFTMLTHPPATTTATTAQFTFTGDDAGSGVAAFECKLDSAVSFTTCTSPLSLSGLAVGDHAIVIRAVDKCGNRVASIDSFTWKVVTPQLSLSISKAGSGGGSVTSSPAGIDCGQTCTAEFDSGSTVALTATSDSTSTFAGWGGACTGTGACEVSMDSAKTVAVYFVKNSYQLRALRTGSGSGSIVSSPGGIDCGQVCTAQFDVGTIVTMSVTPDTTSTFSGWTGACTGTGACEVTMDGAKTVSAAFTRIQHVMTVTRTSGGTITSSPGGISCGAECSASFDAGSDVVLTAVPVQGATFAGWSGACTGATPTCTVTMGSPKAVSARFTFHLTITRTGTGSGVVTSQPGSIRCGGGEPEQCDDSFDGGSTVRLVAAALLGSRFAGWSGGSCSGSTSPTCDVTVDSAMTIFANFPHMHKLATHRVGTGSGSVTSSPQGISCGTTCDADFDEGTVVTLMADASSDSRFTGWEGDCAGSGQCVVTMSQARDVTATFTLKSNDATLSSLTTSAGSLQPTFSASVLTYTLSVPSGTSSLTLRPTCSHPAASVTVEGVPVSCGVDSPPITLAVGTRVVHVRVVAEDGQTEGTYVISITRAAPDYVISSSGALAAGTYHDVTFGGCFTASLDGDVVITGAMTVAACQTLDTNGHVVSGGGSFVLGDGGALYISDPNGITKPNSPTCSSGQCGSIQTSTRSFSIAGDYTYDGLTNQVVGDGLPETVHDLVALSPPSATTPTRLDGYSPQTVTGKIKTVGANGEGKKEYVGHVSLLKRPTDVCTEIDTYHNVEIGAGGKLTLGCDVVVTGDWTMAAGGESGGDFTVKFDSDSLQTITGSPTFYSVVKLPKLTSVGALATALGRITVTHDLTLHGAPGSLLSLSKGGGGGGGGGTVGSHWELCALGTRSVDYVSVSDSDATCSGTPITATHSTDGGGNLNWIFFVPTPTATPTPTGNTQPGTNVLVYSSSSDASVSFSQVSSPGDTTFTAISPNSAGAPPSGYTLCPTCPAYDITTTAVYTPPLTVCLSVPASVSSTRFDSMRLLHGDNGMLVDITTSHVTNPNLSKELCGNSPHLSPFVIAEAAVISGTVTYANSQLPGPATRFVPGVLLSAAGSTPVSDTTGAGGTYSLTSFGSGSYTITASKSGGVNNAVTGFDAAKIAQYATGAIALTAPQLAAADVSGVGGVTSYDASLIARYAAALAPPTGSAGSWKFTPASNTHASIVADITGEDYTALLMGDVSGNWGDPSTFRVAYGPERSAAVTAADIVASPNGDVMIPIAIEGASKKGIISYQFDLRYDPAVIQPQANAVDLVGTLSQGWTTAVNAEQPGLLRVVIYGPAEMDGDGVLLKLRFTAVGYPGTVSPLTWENMLLNEGDPQVTVSDGRVGLSLATAVAD